MRNFMYVVLTFLIVIISCATMQSISPESRTNIIEADYSTTFNAVMNYFQERGFVIKTADVETGLIDTDYKSGSIGTQLLIGDTRTKVNATLSKIGNNQTKIFLTMVAEEKKLLSGWQAMAFEESQVKKTYNKYLIEIKQKAEKSKLDQIEQQTKIERTSILGQITKIEESHIVVNIGSHSGLIMGDQVSILHLIEDSGDEMEVEIGKAEVVSIKEDKAVLKIISKDTNLTIGDKVRK